MKFAKIIISILLISLLATIMNAQASNPNGFSIYKGINISHTLSQCADDIPHRDQFFTEMDVIFLKQAGFDHLRIPVDEIELWDEKGNKKQEAFDYLDKVLSWIKRHNLNAVVDLHTVRAHHFNAVNDGTTNTLFSDDKAQAIFLQLWKDLSEALKKWDNDFLAYEILNEAVADDHEDWNKLLNKSISFIRELEAERTLIVAPNRWQQAPYMKFLRLPTGDKNLILSFHDYSPFLVTHYRAGWIAFKDYEGPVQYPGVSVSKEAVESCANETLIETMKEYDYEKHYDQSVLEENVLLAIEYAKSIDIPLYCGEWGCLPSPGRENRLNYYKDMTAIFNKHKIARANWDYKGSFKVVDRETNEIDWELVNILTQE